MRLANSRLATLPASVRRPRYDRSGVRVGIMHLGIGAFFRTHGALCTDDVRPVVALHRQGFVTLLDSDGAK
jgi:mannitol-1-phosphate/altronate dehydrogenase